jgi:antitoxin CptB
MADAALRWRLRRGMRELDVLLTRYYTRRYPVAPESERLNFERLLECEDPDIWSWLMGYAAVPEEFDGVVKQLRGDA